jgi:hypothetical protein
MGREIWALVMACGASTTACSTSTPAEGLDAPCTRTSDCQAGLVCGLPGFCTPPDASDEDSSADGPADAGDAGDSGPSDAGRVD